MPEMSISRAVTWLAEADPDAVAVRCGPDELSRGELDLVTNRIARRWVDDGLAVDDLVAVSLPNGPDFVLATVAAWKAGATPMPLSPRLATSERASIVAVAGPALVIDGAVDRCAGVDESPLPDLAASCWKAPTSSGSTGLPKLIRSADPARVDPSPAGAGFVPREAVQLVAGPLFHAAPFVYAMRGLMTGHELVVMPRFDATEWLRLVGAHHATWGMLVPTMMQRISRVAERASYDVGSLESVLHLGARCPGWLKRDWIDWLGPERVVELYAGTESQGLALIDGREWLAHPGSVGRPTGGSEFRVARPDGSACEPGEVGEIRMRRDAGSWHTLRDSGHLDADGYLHVGDRLDDVIVTGGAKVQPADVEAVLDQHPRVGSSVVVGRPHDDLGEQVHAVVHTHASIAELEDWVAVRLDPEKRPWSWPVVDVPLRDDTGKVRRRDWH